MHTANVALNEDWRIKDEDWTSEEEEDEEKAVKIMKTIGDIDVVKKGTFLYSSLCTEASFSVRWNLQVSFVTQVMSFSLCYVVSGRNHNRYKEVSKTGLFLFHCIYFIHVALLLCPVWSHQVMCQHFDLHSFSSSDELSMFKQSFCPLCDSY